VTRDRFFRPVVRAGVLTGVVDGLFSSVLAAFFYGSTVTRLFQGVAATLLGNDAFRGGTSTALIGVLMHFGVAFGWSTVFLVLAVRSRAVRNAALPASRRRQGGLAVWTPRLDRDVPWRHSPSPARPAAITIRWWIQLVGHIPFVGLPIVASIAKDLVTGHPREGLAARV
jgi:hypothetical protein